MCRRPPTSGWSSPRSSRPRPARCASVGSSMATGWPRRAATAMGSACAQSCSGGSRRTSHPPRRASNWWRVDGRSDENDGAGRQRPRAKAGTGDAVAGGLQIGTHPRVHGSFGLCGLRCRVVVTAPRRQAGAPAPAVRRRADCGLRCRRRPSECAATATGLHPRSVTHLESWTVQS